MPGAYAHKYNTECLQDKWRRCDESYKVVSDREYIIEARINDSFYLINNAVNNSLLSRLAAGF